MVGLVSRLMKPRKNAVFREPFWADFFSSNISRSGKSVNIDNALQVATVFACLRSLANGVAQPPLKLYRSRTDSGSDEATDHPLFRVLYRRPNQWQTSFEFRESLVFHAVLAGDFIAFKNRVNGQIRELIPLDPGSTTIYRDPRGNLTYQVAAQTSTQSGTGYSEQPPGFGDFKIFPAEAIWHVRAQSWNTWTGLPAIKLAREAIGLSIATEESHARFHANGGQTTGLYSVDNKLGEDAYRRLREWVSKQISGENRYRPFILDNGAKYTPISMTGVDAQHIETRKHQIEEVCTALGVLPIMIGHADKTATYASAEQMFLAHLVHTIGPLHEKIEQSIDVNLLTEQEQKDGLYAKFNTRGFLRPAAKDQAEYLFKLWQMGVLSANEIRAWLEMNPFPEGNHHYIATNIGPLGDDGVPETGASDEKTPVLAVRRIT